MRQPEYRIVTALSGGSKTAADISKELNIPLPDIYKAINAMKAKGLVEVVPPRSVKAAEASLRRAKAISESLGVPNPTYARVKIRLVK